MNLVRFASRVALGVPFVVMGWGAATEPGGRVKAAESVGLPNPELMVRFNGAAMVAGGLGLITGVLPRAAATGLVVALVPTTVVGHAYWRESDPQARAASRGQLLKNLAMAGGLLAVAAARKGAATD